MVNVHKAMREKSERNAAEHKKNCLDAEVSRCLDQKISVFWSNIAAIPFTRHLMIEIGMD